MQPRSALRRELLVLACTLASLAGCYDREAGMIPADPDAARKLDRAISDTAPVTRKPDRPRGPDSNDISPRLHAGEEAKR